MSEPDAPPPPSALERRAHELADGVPDDVLASDTLEAVLERIVNAGAPQQIRLDPSDRYYEQRGDAFQLHYPFTGASDVLLKAGKVVRSISSHGDQHEVTFYAKFNRAPGDGFEDHLRGMIQQIDEHLGHDVEAANAQIAADQAAFAAAARARLEPRWRMVRALRGAMKALNVPLGQRTGSRVNVPVQPSPLSMSIIEEAAKAGSPQWALAEDVADSVVGTIGAFARSLERLRTTAIKLLGEDEETLRDVLLFVLNANFQGRATGETFIGSGKCDLLLRWEDRDAFVGECKIWKGPKALSDGLSQLLDRYTLWRQTRIALVSFIRDPKDATAIIDSAHATLQGHARTRRTIDISEPAARGEYEVLGSGDENRLARLTYIPVVIA